MRIPRSRVLLALLCMLALLAWNLPAMAQGSDKDAPLIVNNLFLVKEDGTTATAPGAGDIPACDYGKLIETGGEPYAVRSPDGKWIAFAASPAIFNPSPDAAAAVWPSNIWICEIATRKVIAIGDQPKNFSFEQKDQPDNWVSHDAPLWSLDSNVLAWRVLIVTGDDSKSEIRLYNMTTKKTATISVDLIGDLFWINAGLIIPQKSESDNFYIDLYSADGKRLSRATVRDLSFAQQPVVITDKGQEYVGLLVNNTWQLLEPKTGKMETMKGLPEMFSTTSPNGLSIGLMVKGDNVVPMLFTSPTDKGTFTIPINYPLSNMIAVSGDGKQVAYAANGDLWLWQQATGKPKQIPGFGEKNAALEVRWGPTAFRIRPPAQG